MICVSPPIGANAVDGNRNLHALVGLRVGWITRDADAVGIGEVKEDARRYKSIGRRGADVEAAKIGLAAGIEAVEGRRHIAADAVNEVCLQAVAEDVTAFVIEAEPLDGAELLVLDDGLKVTDVAP